MERKTMDLRFVEVSGKRRLQQLWIIEDRGKTTQEWRDIPLHTEPKKQ